MADKDHNPTRLPSDKLTGNAHRAAMVSALRSDK
jgi:hypothetical protein